MEEVNKLTENNINNVALNILPRFREAFSKFKSVGRAIRRGHVSYTGEVYPRRPFNNRKSTAGRSHNQMKKKIYERIKGV